VDSEMIEYKLTLFKEVRYYLIILIMICLSGVILLDDKYRLYFGLFIVFICGFSLALFMVKKLFKIKLFGVYQEEIELANKEAVIQITDYQNLFQVTKVFVADMRSIKQLVDLRLRLDIYIKTIRNNELSKDDDVSSYIVTLEEYFVEIKTAVENGKDVDTDYPRIIQEEFAKIVLNRLSKENKEKLGEIKNVKY
jgi:hypothetical protein